MAEDDQAARAHPVRLDEVPSLTSRAEDLEALNVSDVVIREVFGADARSLGWLATVVLYQPRPGPNRPLVWTLGRRPTRESAERAVELFLGGMLEGQRRARAEAPAIEGRVRTIDAASVAAVHEILDDWVMRRFPAESVERSPKPPTDAEELGLQIRGHRKKLGLTQEGFGARIGLTQSQVSQVERGRLQPAPEVLDRIAALVGPVGEVAGAEADGGTPHAPAASAEASCHRP
jgi:DNA-binding XRE family transcriptional regulator